MYEQTLPGLPVSNQTARAIVREIVLPHFPNLVIRADEITGHLATVALGRTAPLGQIRLLVTIGDGGFRIEFQAPDDGHPDRQIEGHLMAEVSQIVTEWGTRRREGEGHRVWAEVS